MDRRLALESLLAGAVGTTLAPAAAAATRAPTATHWTSEFLDFDPVTRFRHGMRLQRSAADRADVLHWYHFIMVAIPEKSAPIPVVRWEGIELSRHHKIGPDRYRFHGHNLSFPRDLDSGKFVDAVVNPLTGERVKVPPMALTNDPGSVISPRGIIRLDAPSAAPRPEYRLFRREGAFVKVDAIRVPPAGWPVTFVEMGCESTPAELFDDARLEWLPSEVSGGYVFPWPEWMNMGKAGGHMFATWRGYKLRDIGELPTEFRQRAEREFPQLLQVDRGQFDTPIANLHPG
ncbi:MAG: hypothetical protein ACO3A8_01775 [Steroidobacteraceae bacterium]|jgi:hypothetical protein